MPLLAFYLFFGLGGYSLLDNNEGLYATIAREMLASHAFIIPTVNGVPYLEKPPLLYWLVALAYSVLGESEVASRIVPVLASAGVLLMLAWLGRKTGNSRQGMFAALILGSSICYVALSRTLFFDMLLTACLTAALVFLYLYFQERTPHRLRWSYAFLALALLIKGLLPLALFGLIALLYPFVARQADWRKMLIGLFDPVALTIFFAIALPWHILAALQNPEFVQFYFVNEHFLRFLDMRLPKDYYTGPWYYYLLRIPLYLFPWSIFLPMLAKREETVPDREFQRFLWLWFLVPLIFFSTSSAKANYYMIIAMPPLALLLAGKMQWPLARGEQKWAIALACLFPLLLLLGGGWMATLSRGHNQLSWLFVKMAGNPWFLPSFGLALVLATMVPWLLAKRKHEFSMLALGFSSLPVIALAIGAIEHMEPWISSRPLADYLRTSGAGQGQVFLYKDFEAVSSLPFYLKQNVPVIDSESNDLHFGATHGKGSPVFVSADQFVQFVRLSRNPGVLVIVKKDRLKEFGSVAAAAHLSEVRRIGKMTVFTSTGARFSSFPGRN